MFGDYTQAQRDKCVYLKQFIRDDVDELSLQKTSSDKQVLGRNLAWAKTHDVTRNILITSFILKFSGDF